MELIEVTFEKIWTIQKRFKTAQDRQKSYAVTRRRELEYKVELNEDLFINVQPVGIVDQKLKELRNKVIPMVKVMCLIK